MIRRPVSGSLHPFKTEPVGLLPQVAGRKGILAEVAWGPVGIVDKLTVFPEADTRDSIERIPPAQLPHRLFPVSTDKSIHARTGNEPVLGIKEDEVFFVDRCLK